MPPTSSSHPTGVTPPTVVELNSPTPTVMDRLRAETRQAHADTESIPFSAAMLGGRLPVDRYVGQLVAYERVHAALDDVLSRSEHVAVRAVWREDLRKVHLLRRDLEHFHEHLDAVPPSAVTEGEAFASRIREASGSSPLTLLGMLYVLEGSTLGATVLRRHIAQAYGLSGDAGLAYYSPYGNDAMLHWKAFRERMNEAVTDPAGQDDVVAGAHEAFERVGRILTTLSAGL